MKASVAARRSVANVLASHGLFVDKGDEDLNRAILEVRKVLSGRPNPAPWQPRRASGPPLRGRWPRSWLMSPPSQADSFAWSELSWGLYGAITADTPLRGRLRRLEQDPGRWASLAAAALDEACGRRLPAEHWQRAGSAAALCLGGAALLIALILAGVQGRRRVTGSYLIGGLIGGSAVFLSKRVFGRLAMRARRLQVGAAAESAFLADDDGDDARPPGLSLGPAGPLSPPAPGESAIAPHDHSAALAELRRQNAQLAAEMKSLRDGKSLLPAVAPAGTVPPFEREDVQRAEPSDLQGLAQFVGAAPEPQSGTAFYAPLSTAAGVRTQLHASQVLTAL